MVAWLLWPVVWSCVCMAPRIVHAIVAAGSAGRHDMARVLAALNYSAAAARVVTSDAAMASATWLRLVVGRLTEY